MTVAPPFPPMGSASKVVQVRGCTIIQLQWHLEDLPVEDWDVGHSSYMIFFAVTGTGSSWVDFDLSPKWHHWEIKEQIAAHILATVECEYVACHGFS